MTQTTLVLPGLSPVARNPLAAAFDAGLMSSDSGVIVLREVASRLGLADVATSSLPDDRDPARVVHTYAGMALARMMAIAAGPCRGHVFDMTDCDDLDALRTDPAFKIACGRAPETGLDLMSQPTLSRLENLADRRVLKRIGLAFIDLSCGSLDRTPAAIVLDIVMLKACSPSARHGRSRARPAGTRALQCARRRHVLRGPREGGGQNLRGNAGQGHGGGDRLDAVVFVEGDASARAVAVVVPANLVAVQVVEEGAVADVGRGVRFRRGVVVGPVAEPVLGRA